MVGVDHNLAMKARDNDIDNDDITLEDEIDGFL
jgi:hypothetical protein